MNGASRSLLAVSGFALAFATACAAIVGVSDVPIPIDGGAGSRLESGDGAGPSRDGSGGSSSGAGTGAMRGNDSGTFARLEAGGGSGTRDAGFNGMGNDAGTAAGECAPGDTRTIGCGNCGTNAQTCSPNGIWQDAMCIGQGACAQNAMQSCNMYGTQTCATGCTWGACSCPSTPVCTPNATQCSGNGVQTCDACGQWGSPWTCATGTCSGGACTGSTTGVSNASCAPGGAGMTNCGANGESCCTSLEVPGGTYYRTYTNDGTGPTAEADPATVSGFRLDKYLVTVGRFRQFVRAWNNGLGYLPVAGSGKHTHLNSGNGLNATSGGYETGWLDTENGIIEPTNTNLACNVPPFYTWTNTAGSQENLPIDCVNWWESYAFCIWDGGFLPSEAEWEFAAVGGSQQREYPWGSTALGTACPGTGCQYAIYNYDYPSGAGTYTGAAPIAPVGTATLGAGLWGQLDMAGDVSEWNLDLHGPYAACTDCANVTAFAIGGAEQDVRGGAFYEMALNLRPTSRGSSFPANRYDSIGFRCSRTP